MGIRISIPHFGTTFGTTRTMYHFDTPLGTTPFTTSVDRLTFLGLCGMYNPVSDNSSGNIPPPAPQATFIFFVVVSCVVS